MISQLALGTAQFGMNYGVSNAAGRVKADGARAILDLGRRVGIDTLDTARAYGSAEETLGEAGVAGWRIVTKIPAFSDTRQSPRDRVRDSVVSSLRALKVSKVDAVLLHDAKDLLSPVGPELYEALRELKGEGICRAIGVSIYSPSVLDMLLSRYSIDLVQAPLNVVDQRLLRSGALADLKRRGIEVHVRSVFLQGLLLMVDRRRPAYFEPWERQLKGWDTAMGFSVDAAIRSCFAFVKAVSGIDRIVVGVESEHHLSVLVDSMSSDTRIDLGAFGSDDVGLIEPSRWMTT